MIRYELKDKEYQAALEKVFPGFGKDLQRACEGEYDDGFCYVRVMISNHETCAVGGFLSIKKEAICAEHAYNPHAWNNYPEMTPPEDTPLRCEGHDADTGRPFRAILRFVDGSFCFDSADPRYRRSLFPDMVIDRFRPWDDAEDGK